MKFYYLKHILVLCLLVILKNSIAQAKDDTLKDSSIIYLNEANDYFENSQFDSAAVFYKKSIVTKKKDSFTSTHGKIIILLLILIIVLHVYLILRNKSKNKKVLIEQDEQISSKTIEIREKSEDIIKINQELEKISIAVNNTDNAILILNPKGEIEWINDGYTRLYGFTFDELIKQKGNIITESNYNPKMNEIFNTVLAEKKSQNYETNVSLNNIDFRIHTTLTPVLNDKNEVERLIAIDSDVTKQREVENELQKLLVTKDKFFSIIAHDLKNPFNSLIGLSQLLVQGFDRMSTEKIKYFHKNLHQISKTGYELLINLLEWSRSQRGTIPYSPDKQDLNILTEETFTLYNSKAQEKEISLINNIGLDSFVFADKNMLKTIFRNLVSNSLKFTDRGGAIEITAESANEFVKISVRDTGVGISDENIKKLFKLDKSYSTSGTEEESGTGLGLILCQEFVEKHNGKIIVESKVGFGSKFIFTLPKVK